MVTRNKNRSLKDEEYFNLINKIKDKKLGVTTTIKRMRKKKYYSLLEYCLINQEYEVFNSIKKFRFQKPLSNERILTKEQYETYLVTKKRCRQIHKNLKNYSNLNQILLENVEYIFKRNGDNEEARQWY